MSRQKKYTHSLLLTLLLMCCSTVYAQFPTDIPSVEAAIANHKSVRYLYGLNAALEAATENLHKETKKQEEAYKELNVDLDKYMRCFDIIDLIYQSAKVVVNTKNTLEDIHGTIQKCKELNETYMDKCLAQRRLTIQDTIIISIYKKMINGVSSEAKNIYNSYYSIAILYGTTVGGCKTSNLLTMLYDINNSMENMRRIMNEGYYALYKYITIRTTFWKSSTYERVTKQEMCNTAISRWRDASLKVLREKKVKTLTEQRYDEIK